MRPTYVWAGLVGLVAILGAVTWLISQGQDPTPLLAFLTGAPATVAAVIAASRTRTVETKVDAVAKNVNGHLSRLSDAAGIPRPRNAEETPS